jgi:hypothetical protein
MRILRRERSWRLAWPNSPRQTASPSNLALGTGVWEHSGLEGCHRMFASRPAAMDRTFEMKRACRGDIIGRFAEKLGAHGRRAGGPREREMRWREVLRYTYPARLSGHLRLTHVSRQLPEEL